MVTYIQRQEAIRLHCAYLDEYLIGDHDRDEDTDHIEECDLELVAEDRLPGDFEYSTGQTIGGEGEGELQPAESATNGAEPEQDGHVDVEPIYYPNPTRLLAVKPTVKNIRIQDVVDDYHASNLISGVTNFLTRRCGVNRRNVLVSPENFISIWHKLYLHHPAPSFAPFNPVRRDVTNRFRTTHDIYEKHGIERYRAGRVRAIFNLPAQLRQFHSGPLAYLEAFTPFDSTPSPFTRLHSTKFDFDARDLRRTLVIPVSDIFFACHLVPKYHTLDSDLELHAGTDLLAVGEKFWLNHYYNHNFYQFIQHWRRRRPTLAERL
ncbi:unnamed protein product [Rhizoctonia solani]|uniref:Uncharacterized protein n=2 Tax=Rhizoctonia solani TaxID=456999 RepID=A0A8H3HQY7_9AGAM